MKLVAVSNYFKLMTWMALDVFCPRYFSISGSEVIQIELQNMAGKLPGPSLLLSPSLSISVALWTHSFCFFFEKNSQRSAAICSRKSRDLYRTAAICRIGIFHMFQTFCFAFIYIKWLRISETLRD